VAYVTFFSLWALLSIHCN